ncbi:MAG TPA: oxidoreductase [Candidatus Faecivivens stercorigallinarum]|nr:oxidoreductase [Candidatus Faecivivens stercorigallinarum]
MKQTASFISTYSADVFGVASALYELGGMTIMHDASGCNSTYNTHDEPRWYDIDSMVYISGLSEMEAVMGDDGKLIDDIVQAAGELSPKFIALAGTPIPMMIGTDYKAVASVIEKKTGIPTFGFATNGMHDYLSGISMAFEAFASRMTSPMEVVPHSVNVLGLTPLDFAVCGYDRELVSRLQADGFTVLSTWSMGCSLEDIGRSAAAEVNLVVSWCGLAAAKKLKAMYGTPYVIGAPVGQKFTAEVLDALHRSAEDKTCRNLCQPASPEGTTVLIGESVTSLSLAAALRWEGGGDVRVICPVCCESQPGLVRALDEDELVKALAGARTVVADPLYQPICKDKRFVRLPHEAFSGRLFRREDVNLLTGFDQLKKEILGE